MAGYETIILRIEGAVAVLTLNRPDAMNALSARLKEELAQALARLSGSEEVRALILTGAGARAFCAGADIKERAGTDPTPEEFAAAQRGTLALFDSLARFPAPTIAALNGVAFGGGAELALACDFRLAAESARIGLPEVNLGVIPAAGGTQRLARLIGPAAAKRMILLGDPVTAQAALAMGLVDGVAPQGELMAGAHALAGRLAAKPPMAVRLAKRVIDDGYETDLASGIELELAAAAQLFASEDRKEGMRAFVEKRAPVFRGQ